MPAFFSLVSVCRNDAWSLTKTSRSIFRQTCKDFEYLVVDGASTDGTDGLVEFWTSQGLVTHAVSEPDTGVYNAMNKALALARGDFVCFLNAGDVFAEDDVLARVQGRLQVGGLDGVLGWGELNGQVWASWLEDEAFKLASLGFCHQALFVRRSLLLQHPFDERSHKTDSDTLQLGRLYAAKAQIAIVPEVLAIRGAEPGISADLERTQRSIRATLVEEYPELDAAAADRVIGFRRRCEGADELLVLLQCASAPLRRHLGAMVLDTLFLRQSMKMGQEQAQVLAAAAGAALGVDRRADGVPSAVERLLHAQRVRLELMSQREAAAAALKAEIVAFGQQEAHRLAKLHAAANVAAPRPAAYTVSLTSFPARVATLHFVVQSLLAQTCPPQEIHIWLGADEIPARHWLPSALLELESRGLRVHFTRRTCHQYDKFLHNSELNQQMPFVIVDDDVIYPPHSMASLWDAHLAHPGAVVANRCHRMTLAADGKVQPYRLWEREATFPKPRLRAFPTGAGGVLYPVGFLNQPDVTDARTVLAHAPYADDIWLKVSALARGIGTVATPLSSGADWYLRYTPTMRSGALQDTNVDLGMNDLQMNRAFAWLDGARPRWRQELAAEDAA